MISISINEKKREYRKIALQNTYYYAFQKSCNGAACRLLPLEAIPDILVLPAQRPLSSNHECALLE